MSKIHICRDGMKQNKYGLIESRCGCVLLPCDITNNIKNVTCYKCLIYYAITSIYDKQ